MRLLIFLLLLPFLQGCAGLAVGTLGTFEAEKKSFQLNESKNSYKINFFDDLESDFTKEELINSWGDPDSYRVNGNCEVLTYYDGYTWSGVGVFLLVIPIPLVVPTGHDENRLYFVDGKFSRMVSEYGEVKHALGYMCGGDGCRWLSGREDKARTRKIDVDWCD